MIMSTTAAPAETNLVPPRPSWLLIAISLVNMALGAVTAAVGLIGLEFIWPTSPFTMFCVMITLVGLGATIMQYLGTFRRSFFGAYLGGTLPSFSLISLLAVKTVAPFFLSLAGDASETDFIADSTSFFPYIVIYGLASFGVNLHWFFKLKAYAQQSGEKKKFAFSLMEILGLCILLAVVVAPASYQAHRNPALYIENASVADVPLPLPTGAQDITYQRNRFGVARATFVVDEKVLKSWLHKNHADDHLNLEEITTPEEISTPSYAQHLFGDTFTVTKGFRATWRLGNRYISLVYDRPSGTAYYDEMIIPAK